MNTRPARRIPVPNKEDFDRIFLNLEPGDYCGPIEGYTADKPSVFYRLPIDLGVPVSETGKGLGHVVSPPHKFTEQKDGSLEIRESILHKGHDLNWHGYLDAGNIWRIL